jgi:carotenoid cleavage dioxygenase-like enzyme
VLLFDPDIDTLPQNTITAVDAIINPQTISIADTHLLTPDLGTRYLILDNIGSYTNSEAAIAWDETNPSFVAYAGDIIEYTNSGWVVKFDSNHCTSYQFVTNLNTNVQYKYDPNTNAWAKSVEGMYEPGNWSIVI